VQTKFERVVHIIAMLLLIIWLGLVPVIAVFGAGAVLNHYRDTPKVTSTDGCTIDGVNYCGN